MVGYIGLEVFTLSRILKGKSLSRFGDGELLLCHGEDARFQEHNDKLATELKRILRGDTPCLVGVPHAHGYRPEYWGPFLYNHRAYFDMRLPYVSAFISRRDEAPAVQLSTIWKDRDVVLVAGPGSLKPSHMRTANSVDLVMCPPKNAWDEIDRLEAGIPDDTDLAILCCGATATVLADRLCRKGIQAVDLGFAGKFM